MDSLAFDKLDLLDCLFILQNPALVDKCYSFNLEVSFGGNALLLHLLNCHLVRDLNGESLPCSAHLHIDAERHLSFGNNYYSRILVDNYLLLIGFGLNVF